MKKEVNQWRHCLSSCLDILQVKITKRKFTTLSSSQIMLAPKPGNGQKYQEDGEDEDLSHFLIPLELILKG